MVKVCDAIMGSGKAQPLDSPVLTQNGFIKMKNLNIGDKVYGEDGNLHNVIGIYPQGLKSVYRVTFSDNTSTECSDEHLWTYQLPQDKAKGVWRTDTLANIIKSDLYKTTNRGDKNWQFFIPITQPLQFPKRDLKIDPYVLGVLLGDGRLDRTISLTNSEKDIVNRVAQKLPNGCRLIKKRCETDNEYYINFNESVTPFPTLIRRYGLLGCCSSDKFIPEEYLTSSVEDRTELLRGLFDTDGCSQGRHLVYYSTSLKLAEGVKWLVQSLGGTGTLTKKEKPFYVKNGERVYCRTCYNVHIRLPQNIMPYASIKHHNYFDNVIRTGVNRSIRNIEYIGEKECQCILVDNPSHLYLTNDCIVTHNTSASVQYINSHPEKRFLYITPYLDEASRINKACPNANFVEPSDKLPKYSYCKSLHALSLIKNGENIASTHKATMFYNHETIQTLRDNNYCLIIDEEIEPFSMDKDIHYSDVKIAVEAGYVKETKPGYFVRTDKKIEYDKGQFSHMLHLMELRPLIKIDQKEDGNSCLYYWKYPIELLKSIDDIIILTYLFKDSEMELFLQMNDIPYQYIGVDLNSSGYTLSDKPKYVPEYTYNLPNMIHVLDDKKLNAIGNKKHDLSMRWYQNNPDKVDQLRRNIIICAWL